MAETFDDLVKAKFTPEEIAAIDREVEREILKMNLAQLRKHLNVPQQRVAELVKLDQPGVSRLERGTDHLLSTMRRFVEALGGELKVHAVFRDRGLDVELTGV